MVSSGFQTAFPKSGWAHYSFEQEALSSPEFLLKLPTIIPEQIPCLKKIHVHWSGDGKQTQKMIFIQSVFFLATQCRLQISRAHRDEARFALRKGMALGLCGQLPLYHLHVLQGATNQQVHYVNNRLVGGSDDLYTIKGIQPYHGFFGVLPGWQWTITTTSNSLEETRLLTTLWKLHLL